MSPYLEWIDENGHKCGLEVVDKVFIGRTCTGIEKTKRIIVNDPSISRDHAIINLLDTHLQITDMSRNGVWVNDIRMDPGSLQVLSNGDVIGIGNIKIFVNCPASQPFNIDMDSTQVSLIEMTVTSLVADVRGFSGMTQKSESSEIYFLMKSIFDQLTAIVHDFKGTLKDYVGDAVYAFWDHGLTPKKDQAVLACKAALEQMSVINNKELFPGNSISQEVLMGWGITTGKVTMAHYSQRSTDLTLVGDCTNLAFRLSGMANKEIASPIVICSQTADLVENDISLLDLGSVTIRGRTGQEHVFGLDI